MSMSIQERDGDLVLLIRPAVLADADLRAVLAPVSGRLVGRRYGSYRRPR